ncbi:MAG: bacillithiol biosynthesis cysteine-adding enzyme BshC, partial [Bacteroidia bacterium]|nr:bacillithiol biosynthesis cysteine-adding enzyme BshC [Bacteroidia bacterium]
YKRQEYRALLEAAYTTPERLSPNVLLRPLYQEWLFPSVAYVAGPAEVAYWLELGPVFEAFGIPMPVIYPRGHVRVLPPLCPPLPEGMDWSIVFSLSQGALRRQLAFLWGREEVEKAREWWERNRPPFEELQERPFLAQAVRHFSRVWQQWGRLLHEKSVKAAYHRYQKQVDKILTFRAAVEPEGRLQERSLNIHAFSSEAPREWIRNFLRQAELRPAQWLLYQGPMAAAAASLMGALGGPLEPSAPS